MWHMDNTVPSPGGSHHQTLLRTIRLWSCGTPDKQLLDNQPDTAVAENHSCDRSCRTSGRTSMGKSRGTRAEGTTEADVERSLRSSDNGCASVLPIQPVGASEVLESRMGDTVQK